MGGFRSQLNFPARFVQHFARHDALDEPGISVIFEMTRSESRLEATVPLPDSLQISGIFSTKPG